MTPSYEFTVLAVRKPRGLLILCSGSHKTQIKVWVRLGFYLEALGENQLHSHCLQNLVLCRCRTEVPVSFWMSARAVLIYLRPPASFHILSLHPQARSSMLLNLVWFTSVASLLLPAGENSLVLKDSPEWTRFT